MTRPATRTSRHRTDDPWGGAGGAPHASADHDALDEQGRQQAEQIQRHLKEQDDALNALLDKVVALETALASKA